MSATHEVTNQVPPLFGHDPIAGDAALAEACVRHGGADVLASLAGLGRLAGSEQAQEWGRVANENPPRLRTHDRYGHRIDEVEFQRYLRDLMRTAVENGLAGAPWADAGPAGDAGSLPAMRPRRRLLRVDAWGAGPWVPDHDDLRRLPPPPSHPAA